MEYLGNNSPLYTGDVHEISVGFGLRDSIRYTVGTTHKLLGKEYKVNSIVDDTNIFVLSNYNQKVIYVTVKSEGEDEQLWKTLINQPCVITHKIK